MSLKTIIKFFLDILFPIYCIGCGKEGEWICKNCFRTIELMEKQVCPICNEESLNGSLCQKCKFKSRLSGIMIAAHYDDEFLQNAIHTLKYKFVKDIASSLGELLSIPLKNFLHDKQLQHIILIPIPLYKLRQRERGFNQSTLIANYLSKKLTCASKFNIPVCEDILVRQRATKSQMQLDPLTRRKNIKNAFKCINAKKVQDKIVVLVDDVCTTSATLEECAKELYNAGCKEIWGLVLARGR